MKKIIFHGVKGERIEMANWKQRERIPGQIVDRQNKRIKISQSASYGSLTYWRNKDFWQAMLLYFCIIGLFFIIGYIVNLIQ